MIYGKGEFDKAFMNDSNLSFKLQLGSLTESHNELASFRSRALTGNLSKEENLQKRKYLNSTQLKWLDKNKDRVSVEKANEILKEYQKQEDANLSYWKSLGIDITNNTEE